MKRVLILLTATAVMVLMFASAAPAVVHLCTTHLACDTGFYTHLSGNGYQSCEKRNPGDSGL